MRFKGLELSAETIRALEKLLNSRIGFALMILVGFIYYVVPDIKAIRANTDVIASEIRQTHAVSSANRSMLERIVAYITFQHPGD